MIVDAGFLTEWQHRGHVYGECMSHADSDLMYIHIPKNASSWTKPNLLDFGWEFYNYHHDHLNKLAIVVLRDPVERWLSGIAEYMTLYHPSFEFKDQETVELVFDRITFDDHTECQVKFIDGLDTDRCIFLRCDTNYRSNFSKLIREYFGDNKYDRYEYQHVSEDSKDRKYFKQIFKNLIDKNPTYLQKVQDHFKVDYDLINTVTFYGEQ